MAKLRALGHMVSLSRLVRERAAFVLRQALRRPVVRCYHLKDSGLAFYLRHGTPDVNTFEQMFDEGHYELPREIAASLPSGEVTAVDLGANVGMFGLWLRSRFPQARITAFEPDPDNARVLSQTAAANARNGDWRVVEAAAGNRDGEITFVTGDFTNSRVAEAGEAGTAVPLVDVFPFFDDADFVKIDIEGAEWDLTSDPRFAELRAPVVAFEYHPGRAVGDPRS